jgi:serine/threonine-protein kinase
MRSNDRARLSVERWRRVIPLLDSALDLPREERASWLDALRQQDASLAEDVAALLEEHDAIEAEGFLDRAPPAARLRTSLAGQVVGAYTLLSQIGQGGMGSVWLAERSDGRFQGQAAVKLLNASLVGRDGEARFRREGNILARLRHPHIAHLIDAGVSALGQPYLVLEHVDGEPIDRYCDARALGIEARTRLFLDVLAAVTHAHANLVVHRDLKPSNVLVAADGEVKLLDFGIAKLLENEAGDAVTALTGEGNALLTPEYAAPEQLTAGDVTTATDVYALGVLLYVMLTGRHPARVNTDSPAELVRAIVDTEPFRPSDAVVTNSPSLEGPDPIAARRGTTARKLRGALRGDLDNIVGKAIRKRPSERYASVEALADDLRRHLGHLPVYARPDSLAYRCARFVRRNRAAAALAVLALLALSAGLLGTVSQARRATAQAALAESQRVRAEGEARVAGAQRDFALRQLSRAEALNDLNSFVLSDAPTLGQRFTVGELLDRAERSVDRQQGVSGEDRVELLLAIGYQYQSLDQHAKGREVLTKAYDLAGKSSDVATRAKAACALASAVGQAGEGERAEQLLRQAESELPKEPQFALHRVFCLEMGSVVAQERGDARAAVQRAQSAQQALSESRFDSAVMDMRLSFGLATAYHFAGRLREAADAYERSYGRLQSLGREDTRTAGAILNNWGNVLLSLGRPLEAERHFRRAVQGGSATEESATPMRLLNLARALRELERLAEATDYAERAHAKFLEQGHEAGVDQSLFARATLYRLHGDLDRAAVTLARIEPRLKRLPAGHIWFGVLSSERAQLAQARGDSAAALAEADRAVAIAEASTQRAYLARFLLRRSEVAFQSRRLERAATDAETAVRLELEASAGAFSSNVGHCYLALGRALEAQGRRAEARVAYTSAVEHLERSLGAEHPATRESVRSAERPVDGR